MLVWESAAEGTFYPSSICMSPNSTYRLKWAVFSFRPITLKLWCKVIITHSNKCRSTVAEIGINGEINQSTITDTRGITFLNRLLKATRGHTVLAAEHGKHMVQLIGLTWPRSQWCQSKSSLKPRWHHHTGEIVQDLESASASARRGGGGMEFPHRRANPGG